jgi:hypothetical protein
LSTPEKLSGIRQSDRNKIAPRLNRFVGRPDKTFGPLDTVASGELRCIAPAMCGGMLSLRRRQHNCEAQSMTTESL